MSVDVAIASICKDLRMLGEHELANKALVAYAAVTNTEAPRVDLSYSYLMRQLRKGKTNRRKKFQVAFKEAFDRALLEDLDEPAAIALMVAMKAINLKIDELEEENGDNNNNDVVTKSRESLFGPEAPGIGDSTIPNQLRIGVPPHADSEFSNLSRIAATKVFCKCKSSSLLKPKALWWGSREKALSNPANEGGRLYSALLMSGARVERFDKPITDKLINEVFNRDIDAAALRDNLYLVLDPSVLVEIQEEEDINDADLPGGWVPGERDNSTRNIGLQYAYPGSSSGIGGMPDGAAGIVQLPFGSD